MTTLSIHAKITPKPEHYAEVQEALEALLPPTHAEEGCQRFELHFGREDDKNLYLVEVWDNDAALDFHYRQPYVIEILHLFATWLQEPPTVLKMTPAA